MCTNILANKRISKESILIVGAAAFIIYYFSIGPIFAEYIETLIESGKTTVASSTSVVATPPGKEWSTIESNYFTINYRPEASLKAIDRKLRKRLFDLAGTLTQSTSNNPSRRIARRLDGLLKRVKDILGMQPRNMHMNVYIFKNRKELIDEHQKIFGERKNLKSFYIYKYNTIYTTESDISDSVIAHEMGHAVVDHYFVVRPPERVREILATYVDLHLED